MNNDKDLADQHVEWYMSRLREQMLAWCDITEQLLKDNFLHGIKHGREMEREDADTPWVRTDIDEKKGAIED